MSQTLDVKRFPAEVLHAPALRGLDERGLGDIAAAGRLFEVAAGQAVYREGDTASAFYVVASGRVALMTQRRGDTEASELREAGVGEAFGEEAAVAARRGTTALSRTKCVLAEVPAVVFQRCAERAGAVVAARLLRGLRRSAARDLLRASVLGRRISERDLDLLLDAVRHDYVGRDHTLFRPGEAPTEVFVVADGMIRIEADRGDHVAVLAYLGRGDLVGDNEVFTGTARAHRAVAAGPSHLLALPVSALRGLSELRTLLNEVHRFSEVERAPSLAAHTTAHVLRDLYRLEVARSLLVIDLENCVRCGHCAHACGDLHGVSRLVRRGDRIATRLEGQGEGPRNLLLPSSCQHCESPTCMPACPTGAIVRDGDGEVHIRDELCTGCGACAKACPWDNIQMAVRPEGTPRPAGGLFPDLAVKCDLCHDYDGPACVAACPVDAVARIDPQAALPEVRGVLRGSPKAASGASSAGVFPPPRRHGLLLVGASIAAVAVAVAASIAADRGAIEPSQGIGLGAGIAAFTGVGLLLAYAFPKRAIRFFARPPKWLTGSVAGRVLLAMVGAQTIRAASDGHAKRSRVTPQLAAHLGIGIVTVGLVLAHAPLSRSLRATSGAAAGLGFGLAVLAGVLAALAYRFIPARLSRIERSALLPEDYKDRRREQNDQFFRALRGRSQVVKTVVARDLLPYATSWVGPLWLVLRGRRLRDEEAAVRLRIGRQLAGEKADAQAVKELLSSTRMEGLDGLITLAVEMRALPAARWLTRLLRLGLPLHIVTFLIASALLVLHVVTVGLGR